MRIMGSVIHILHPVNLYTFENNTVHSSRGVVRLSINSSPAPMHLLNTHSINMKTFNVPIKYGDIDEISTHINQVTQYEYYYPLPIPDRLLILLHTIYQHSIIILAYPERIRTRLLVYLMWSFHGRIYHLFQTSRKLV